MRLSIFVTATDPARRGDNWRDALTCYGELADELVIVNGGSEPMPRQNLVDYRQIKYKWPREFDWPFIGEQFQRGYEATTGDWSIHCDLDYIFHERDFGKVRQALRDYPNSPGISFYKWQFIQPDRYNLKSRLIIAVNKAVFGDRIKFDGGGDLCQPTLDGKLLDLAETPQAGVPFWNYEKLCKSEAQIMDDVGRMDRAYQRHFGKWLYSEDGTDESAYAGWLQMMTGRYEKPSKKIPLSEHPKYIRETIKNLKPYQFGYNGFGNFEVSYK